MLAGGRAWLYHFFFCCGHSHFPQPTIPLSKKNGNPSSHSFLATPPSIFPTISTQKKNTKTASTHSFSPQSFPPQKNTHENGIIHSTTTTSWAPLDPAVGYRASSAFRLERVPPYLLNGQGEGEEKCVVLRSARTGRYVGLGGEWVERVCESEGGGELNKFAHTSLLARCWRVWGWGWG